MICFPPWAVLLLRTSLIGLVRSTIYMSSESRIARGFGNYLPRRISTQGFTIPCRFIFRRPTRTLEANREISQLQKEPLRKFFLCRCIHGWKSGSSNESFRRSLNLLPLPLSREKLSLYCGVRRQTEPRSTTRPEDPLSATCS